MISETALGRAVAEGILTSDQAARLSAFAREIETQEGAPSRRDDRGDAERLRFVSGFGDIFVTLGLVLFLGAAAYLLDDRIGEGWTAIVILCLAWGLAEFFTRVRRMALPSIVLLLVFVAAAWTACAWLFGAINGTLGLPIGWLGSWLMLGGRSAPASAAAALGTTLFVALHYWRFRVPITIAAGLSTILLAVLLALFAADPDLTGRLIDPLLLVAGLIAFAAAMRFDLADPLRSTRATDKAFWLHLLAAPLIVHSIFHAIGAEGPAITPAGAVVVLAVFLALGLVAVLVDRRALLVSGLVYAGYAFGSIIRRAGLSDTSVPATLLALGAFVLLLSAGWRPLRMGILRLLPRGLSERLPRPL